MKNYHVCNNHLFNIWSCCTCMCNLRSVITFLSAKKTSSYWYHINSCKKCLISCIHVHILCLENCSSENVRQLGKNSQKRLPINCYWYMCACIYKEKSLHSHVFVGFLWSLIGNFLSPFDALFTMKSIT